MNWQVVKDLVAYGREQEKIHDKHFRFTVTTNGVLLNDEIQEFVNKEMDNVVLSFGWQKKRLTTKCVRLETEREVMISLCRNFRNLQRAGIRRSIT